MTSAETQPSSTFSSQWSTVDRILKLFDSTDTCKDEDWSGIDDDFEWFC